MACSISLTSVNGIVAAGQAQPSRLRVTGSAVQCTSGQVIVTSNVTAASPPATLNANGQFRIEVPFTSPLTCGAPIQVRVECVGDPTCFVQFDDALPCCDIPMLYFRAVRPVGSLAPTQLVVSGVLHGCAADQVIISSPVTVTSPPVAVDPFTGEFSTTLPFSSAVQCGAKLEVTAACATPGGCTRTEGAELDCPGCYSAEVTTASGPCVGSPPVQPITFASTIAVPAGASRDFSWEFGDGTNGTPFTINNTTGTAASTHQHSEVHDYAPGAYTATLRISPPPFECDELTVPVVAACGNTGCPTVSQPVANVAQQCVNGKRTATLSSSVTAPAAGAVVYWDFGDGTFSAPSVVGAGATVASSVPHDYPPGTYHAVLKTVQPSGCPDRSVSIVVTSCPSTCNLQIQNIHVQTGACDPVTGRRPVMATAVLSSPDPSDQFFWQWDTNPAQAPGGSSASHDYASPGTGTNTAVVRVTVVRSGGCVASFDKTITFGGCDVGCPEIVSNSIDASGPCTADRARRTVSLDAVVNGGGFTHYDWDFGDGATASIPVGAGPRTSHEFRPGTYTVRLTVTGPGACSTSTQTVITVDACCPAVTDLTATQGSCRVGCCDASRHARRNRQRVSASDLHVGLRRRIADGVHDLAVGAAPPVPAWPVRGDRDDHRTELRRLVRQPDLHGGRLWRWRWRGGGGGGSISCAVLLWISVILMALGGLLVVLGCILTSKFPQAGLILMIIGAAVTALGLLLFLLWLWLCASFTDCPVILAVRAFVIALIAVFAVIAAVLAILALFGLVDLWPCSAASTAYGLGWGTILAVLDGVAIRLGCLTVNPSGAGSSSSGLTSAGSGWRDPMRAPSTGMPAAEHQIAGLGDAVGAVTTKMGIEPCRSCQERARRLNAMFPFGRAGDPVSEWST